MSFKNGMRPVQPGEILRDELRVAELESGKDIVKRIKPRTVVA